MMTKKIVLSFLIACTVVVHANIAATHGAASPLSIAYVPEMVKASIDFICDITNPQDLPDSLRNFFFAFEKDENVSSRAVVKKATEDALAVLQKAKDKFVDKSHFTMIADYLKG